VFYDEPPPVLIMEYPDLDIETSHTIQLTTASDVHTLSLKGIVYHGSYQSFHI
jgi:hypothetical protein